MRNGIKIIRNTDGRIRTVFVPEEIVQINRLNARIQRNIALRDASAMAVQAQEAEAARCAKNHYGRIQKTVRSCVRFAAVGTVVWLAVPVGLATPLLAICVSLPCLCGICYKLGALK